ncbi:J domain-containing protein [Neorhodopirellula pilleata]|uniref:DnaJ domain protein n=1 Tax=Neorhodopirellula pilleata TaxID=2714738 RepID=A0A5C5ZF18_9BACT|nr:J domain-containing protein [Neorhodopirellula pilleata]TWT86039.1 DnaJ domain protein [Neorhodopirellula pilleata]
MNHSDTLHDVPNDAGSVSPFRVLDLPEFSDEAVVRRQYLELVKQHPPERDPEKFRQIQAAYEAARDPLVLARLMLTSPEEGEPPKWSDVIDRESNQRPKIDADFLLSLGNRTQSTSSGEANRSSTVSRSSTAEESVD